MTHKYNVLQCTYNVGFEDQSHNVTVKKLGVHLLAHVHLIELTWFVTLYYVIALGVTM